MSNTTTTEIGDIRFRFQHAQPIPKPERQRFSTDQGYLEALEKYLNGDTPGTACQIVTGGKDDAVVIGRGATYLHPGDQFNRALGRKLAARRAIEMFAGKGHDGRAIRKALWETLFKQSPKTRTASIHV